MSLTTKTINQECLTIFQRIENYRQAYDVSFRLGIRHHYLYYRRQILILLEQLCETYELQVTAQALQAIGACFYYQDGKFYITK